MRRISNHRHAAVHLTGMGFDFSALAARYATYRPPYPAALADLLAGAAPARELAWDAGCGTGQLSVALAGHVHDHYARLAWPWPAVAAPEIAMCEAWTRDELLGYVGTWSATSRYLAAQGPTALDDLAARLAVAWPDGERREIRWPLTIKLAHVPH